MIYNKMEVVFEVEWLDPEGTDKAKRRVSIGEHLLKLFSHEFGEMMVEKHGIKIELTILDGIVLKPSREIKEPSEVSASDNNR
jgi:hypothetical protein